MQQPAAFQQWERARSLLPPPLPLPPSPALEEWLLPWQGHSGRKEPAQPPALVAWAAPQRCLLQVPQMAAAAQFQMPRRHQGRPVQ